MQLRQLEYFVAIAEAGSITSAAASLLVAQPSLSNQIQALERELGAQLFERLPRGIRLTPAGRVFLEDARETLNSLSRAAKRVRQVEDSDIGELEIGTVRSLSVGLLPGCFEVWRRRHPGVSLRLREFVHKDELEHAVRSGFGDLGVGPVPERPFPEQVVLGEEEFVVVLPADDELAALEAVDLLDLSERRWVLFASDHGLSEVVGRACRKAGFIPDGAVQTHQAEAAVRFAAGGLGPALVPRNVIPSGVEAAVLPLKEPLTRELAVYSREPFTRLAQTWVEALVEATSGRDYL